MSYINETRIVLGSLRYKSAPDTTIGLKVPLIQTFKENIEFDRTINIELEQVFNDERQKSTIFRPTGKFSLIFLNAYTGTTNYVPLENNLYYVNAEEAAFQQCLSGTVSWSGFPQYNEFNFIRNDYNVSGYTTPNSIGEFHRLFIPKSASSYNWNFFISYPFLNDPTQTLNAIEPKTGLSLSWTTSDGIPFVIRNRTDRGLDIISFISPIKHGIQPGESIKLNFNYVGLDTFQVFSFGDGTAGSDEYIVNIINIGYLGNTFNDNVVGTFKRVIDIENPLDTTSEYYVRKHKLLTDPEDAVMVNAGFEQNIFGVKKKYESSGLTPNNQARVSIREGSQSYTLTFNKDIDILPLLDNQKRPITKLYFTVVWKGYFGLMFGTKNNQNNYVGLKKGYEFNLPLITTNNISTPSPWWNKLNTNSNTNFPVDTYTNPPLGNSLGPGGSQLEFTYIRSLKKDDILDGDLCEWNNSDQNERVISNLFHKFTYNPFLFRVNNSVGNNPLGYYYQPHHPITLKVYSDYIENGDKKEVAGIPDYSYFSEKEDAFIWRDLYEYGYIDSDGIGVNYPFINGKHYPFQNVIFRVIPEGTNYIEQFLINDPIIDPCE
jgi:hypothetical protein